MPIPRVAERANENQGGGGGRFSAISVLQDGKWSCNVCGIPDNWATRSRCRSCKAYGPRGSGGGGKGSGVGQGWKGVGKGFRTTGGAGAGGGGSRSWGGGTGGDNPTLAQRQIQRQQEDQRLQRIKDEARRKEEALRAANTKLQKELAAAKGGQKIADDDEAMDEDEDTEESRQEKIEATQRAIPYLVLRFGEGSEQVEKARGEVEELLRAVREAKPYKTHRGQLERRLERLRRQQERAREEEDEMLREIEVAQTKLNKLRLAIDEREKGIAAADEELKDLLRKAIAENEPTEQQPATTIDPSTAWTTINDTLANMAAQPGVPPAWAAQLGGLLEQVRVAAIAIQQQASTISSSTSSPSPPPSSKSPPSKSASAQSPTPPSAASTEATPTRPAVAAASASSSSWESRALELAFAEGSSGGGGGKGGGAPSDERQETPTTTGSGQAQGTAAGNTSTAQHTATPTLMATAPTAMPQGDGFETGTDAEESDDEMASVLGAEDLDKREGESAGQHRLRLARHLKERAARKREERQREGKSGRKKKNDAKDRQTTRDRPHQKKK